MTSLINASSPLVWDGTMLESAEVYASANQACIITPFILAGAMAPATSAASRRRHAEALAGITFTQIVRAGYPGGVRFVRQFDVDLQVGRPSSAHRKASPRCCTRRPARVGCMECPSGRAARCTAPRCPTPRLPTSRWPRDVADRDGAASTSSCTPPAGWRAGWRSATRSSCSTAISSVVWRRS